MLVDSRQMTVCQVHRLDSSSRRECSFCSINPGHNTEAPSLNSLAGEEAALTVSQGVVRIHTNTDTHKCKHRGLHSHPCWNNGLTSVADCKPNQNLRNGTLVPTGPLFIQKNVQNKLLHGIDKLNRKTMR